MLNIDNLLPLFEVNRYKQRKKTKKECGAVYVNDNSADGVQKTKQNKKINK